MLVLSIIVCIAMNLNCNFWIYEGLLITLLFMMGFSFTSTTALAMECEREHAGTASALSGAVGFGFGGLVSPLVGLDDTMVTTGIAVSYTHLDVYKRQTSPRLQPQVYRSSVYAATAIRPSPTRKTWMSYVHATLRQEVRWKLS